MKARLRKSRNRLSCATIGFVTLEHKKEIGALAFISLYSVLVFLLFVFLIQPQGQTGAVLTISFAAVALLWVALVQYAWTVNYDRAGKSWVLFVIIPLLIIGLGRLSVAAIAGAAISLLFLFIARSYIYRELKSRIRFRASEIFPFSTRYTLLALAFGLVGMSFPGLTERFNASNLQIPEKYVQSVLQVATPLVGQLVHGFDPSKTVDQFLVEQVKGSGQVTVGDTAVPPGELTILRHQFAAQFGVPVAGEETLASVAGGIVNRYVQSWAKDNNWIFIGVVVILLFLTWRAIIPFLVWPTLALLWLINVLALRIGLVHTIVHTVNSERVQY